MVDVIDIDLKKFAAELRRTADEIERGDVVAIVMVSCDGDGTSGNCCMVDQTRASHELLDEMCYAAKQMLFESFEDGK
jgi:hypothetical protein